MVVAAGLTDALPSTGSGPVTPLIVTDDAPVVVQSSVLESPSSIVRGMDANDSMLGSGIGVGVGEGEGVGVGEGECVAVGVAV